VTEIYVYLSDSILTVLWMAMVKDKSCASNTTKPEKTATQDPRIARLAAVQAVMPPTAVPSVEQQISTNSAPLSSLDAFLTTYHKSERIGAEIDTIERKIEHVTATYHQRRKEKCHFIDNELPRRFEDEQRRMIQKLTADHTELVAREKAKYKELKQEQAREVGAIVHQKEMKKQEKEALDRDLNVKRQGLSKNELIEFFLAHHHGQDGEGRKRKREDSDGSVE
jgi:hypothetical protein